MLCFLLPLAVFAFWLREPICWYLLNDSLSEPAIYSVLGWHDNFRYWHTFVLFLFNPVVLVNYGHIGALFVAFIYSGFLVFYLLVCYFISLLVAIEFASVAYENLKRYNRGSLCHQSIHRCRCYVRDLLEGHATMPHALHYFLLICFSGLLGRLFHPKLYSGTLLQFSLFANICLDNTMVSSVALCLCGSLS